MCARYSRSSRASVRFKGPAAAGVAHSLEGLFAASYARDVTKLAGATLNAAAAALSVIPSSIVLTKAKRPASPSLALACRCSAPSFERESGKTHSLERGPDRPSAVHNVCRRVN
jgi:hypothetical protein